ncbi:MAG: hypothetical protein LAT68_09075 [Cyclobacteriaceae bacterium]|nr:hypothetical protein [Cyclobacteriaceae bacterium]MCH8516467.1 hypothetical protein [Cyclobacteriaceae bacterium]
MIRGILGIILFLAFAMSLPYTATAQEEEVSDDEIISYIMVMDSFEILKAELGAELNELIKSNEILVGSRYVEIKKAYGDDEAMELLDVSEEELEAFETLNEAEEKLKADLTETYKEMIMEEIGGRAYNIIQKKRRSDREFKERYDEIVAQLQESDSSDEESEDLTQPEENESK